MRIQIIKKILRIVLFTFGVVLIGISLYMNNENVARYFAADGIIKDSWEFITILRYRTILIFWGLFLISTSFFYNLFCRMFNEYNYKLLLKILLLISSIVIFLASYPYRNLYLRAAWDLSSEYNVPAIWSTLQYFIIAIFILGMIKNKKQVAKWYFIVLMIIFLGFDELCSIHEKIGFLFSGVISSLYPNFSLQIPPHSWIIVYIPFLIFFAIYGYKVFFKDLMNNKKSFFTIIIGCIVFLTGAVLMEFLEIIEVQKQTTLLTHRLILEESLEMFGVVIIGLGLIKLMVHPINAYLDCGSRKPHP